MFGKPSFLSTVVIGAILIVWSNLDHWNPWAQLIWPLVPMGIYGFNLYVYITRGNSGSADLTDSIYYVGFLFTLVSLVTSQIHFLFTSKEVDLPQLIGNFGIALTTTLAGITGRLFLVQKVEEKGSPANLGESYDQVKFNLVAEVQSFIDSMKQLKKEHRTFFEEALPGTTGAIEDLPGIIEKNLTEVGNNLSSQFSESFGSVAEELNQMVTHINDRNSVLAKQLEQDLTNNGKVAEKALKAFESQQEDSRKAIVRSIEDFQKKLEQFKPPTDLFKEAFSAYFSDVKPVLKEMREAINGFNQKTTNQGKKLEELTIVYQQVADVMGQMPARIEGFVEIPAQIGQVNEQLKTFAENLGKIPKIFKDTSEQSEKVTKDLNGYAESIKSIAEAGKAYNVTAKEQNKEHQAAAKAVNEATEVFLKTLVESLKSLNDAFKKWTIKSPKKRNMLAVNS